MLNCIIPHQFNQSLICQLSEDTIIGGRLIPAHYCNATQMCKGAGKRFNNYTRNERTKAYLNALADQMQCSVNDLVLTNESAGQNDSRGTWIHPALLEHFGKWLQAHKSNRTEKEVQEKLHSILGGDREVCTPAGFIDILTSKEIIEVKEASNWKAGVGQLIVFQLDYPTHQMRLHIFGNYSPNFASLIKNYATPLNIELTEDDPVDYN